MDRHVKILAVLNIVWGSLGLLGALILLAVFGSALGIIGAAAHNQAEAGVAIPIVGAVGAFIIFVILITSIPAIVAGIGLLRLASWGRIVGIIVSVLHLLNVPFGTALGIYGLWVLLSSESQHLFEPGQHQPPLRI